MPRYKTTITTTKTRVESADINRVRTRKQFIDPFPEVHGTLPEKMVYAELSRLGVPFLFLNDLRFQIAEIEFDKKYQADFVIPSLKLIIEVQGAFWHSKPAAIDADAFKFTIYEIGGYKVLAWWDFDIVVRLMDLILEEPLLRGIIAAQPLRNMELPVQARSKVDTSKGIRTLNTRRRKLYKQFVGTGRRKIRKAIM